MRHQKKGRKFSRKTNQRRALFKSALNSLIKCEKIRTTEAKAKELKPNIEKLVSRAKINSVANIRLLAKTLEGKSVKKLVNEIAPKYAKRPGGYTRIIKLGVGRKDASKMAIIEFV